MRSKSKRSRCRENRKLRDIQIINIISFMSILIVFSLGTIVLPKKTISENEKRELAKFPEFTINDFISGEYFAQIDNFYSDTFPMRDRFLEIASYIEDIKGVRDGEDEIKIYNVKSN